MLREVNMKTFSQWCDSLGYDLKSVETPTTEGAGKRQAVRTHELPPQAGRGNYPKGYFQSVPDNLVYNKDKD